MAENKFPITLLFKAYDILEQAGEIAFNAYVSRLKMPAQDIERVRNKYKYNHDPAFRTEINEKFLLIKQILDKGENDLNLSGDEIPF